MTTLEVALAMALTAIVIMRGNADQRLGYIARLPSSGTPATSFAEVVSSSLQALAGSFFPVLR
ncbi:hypothetical protein [Bradyrhizobium sacchari]|uniref:hypothetical protein n=1 Tax=Bradyrhizobium sacchari TaxID=1399419 RepID=UPI0010A968CD|nr:hypothetical protein [Bradyrhizobium sacchari]